MSRDFTMQLYRSFAQKILVVMLVGLLAACSAARLGYSHGETITYWWLDSYVDFDSAQKPWVKQRIDHLFAWHRHSQLEDYAQLMSQIQQQLQQSVTSETVAADAEALKKRTLLVIDQAMPELADLSLSLQPQQIANIDKKLTANNEKYRREYLSGDVDERQRARYKQVMTHAEYWFGSFSRDQEAKIRAASDARPIDVDAMMAMLVRRQRELINVLKTIAAQKPERKAVMQMLRNYVTASQANFGDAKLQAANEAYKNSTLALATSIVNMTTPKQKAFAQERLKQWMEDCRRMALTS